MSFPSLFRYCPHCAAPLVPGSFGHNPRNVCSGCGWIQYRNPTVGVAVILQQHDTVLVGRRRDGGWCFPCGHVEWDEHVEAAAIREFEEETGLFAQLDGVYAVHSNFHVAEKQTVGIWYRSTRATGQLKAGDDLVEVRFADLGDMPALKFPTDRLVLQELASKTRPQRSDQSSQQHD